MSHPLPQFSHPADGTIKVLNPSGLLCEPKWIVWEGVCGSVDRTREVLSYHWFLLAELLPSDLPSGLSSDWPGGDLTNVHADARTPGQRHQAARGGSGDAIWPQADPLLVQAAYRKLVLSSQTPDCFPRTSPRSRVGAVLLALRRPSGEARGDRAGPGSWNSPCP